MQSVLNRKQSKGHAKK